MTLLWLLAACVQPRAWDPVPALTRTSLDLRGVRPSAAEIERIQDDPSQLDVMVDEFLHDERFGGRVRDLWAEVYQTRMDSPPVTAESYHLSQSEPDYLHAVGEQPLEMLSFIAENDLPYTEIVTADWTMADESLAAAWPVDYPEGATGWQQVPWTDGRPALGVLASTSLWWRYPSNASNANRKRANAASRLFLCDDFLARPITFDRSLNLLDGAAVTNALRTDPGCKSCHDTLDPLASALFGFWWYLPSSASEASYYHPERESLWRGYTEVPPAYFGERLGAMADLGQLMAADTRFPDCAARQAFTALLRREPESDAEWTRHRDAFVESGANLRTLLGSIARDDVYRATSDAVSGAAPRRVMTPDLLATSVADLTGLSFTATYDLLRTDTVGYRILAGGVDGQTVTRPAGEPNATQLLVVERLAEAAAWYVVHSEPERLFTLEVSAEPADPAFAEQIQSLTLRILSRRVEVDGTEVAELQALWRDLYALDGDAAGAWTGVVAALLRDPDFLTY